MTFGQFKEYVLDEVSKCPPNWRRGQSVFNIIDGVFGVARYVQFEKHIDCFYNDDSIDDFIKTSYDVIYDKYGTKH